MVRIAMNELTNVPKAVILRRRRFQKGSLQKRKSAGCWQWIAFWWEDHHRKSQVLGRSGESRKNRVCRPSRRESPKRRSDRLGRRLYALSGRCRLLLACESVWQSSSTVAGAIRIRTPESDYLAQNPICHFSGTLSLAARMLFLCG